jgi:hypothetical protein
LTINYDEINEALKLYFTPEQAKIIISSKGILQSNLLHDKLTPVRKDKWFKT